MIMVHVDGGPVQQVGKLNLKLKIGDSKLNTHGYYLCIYVYIYNFLILFNCICI